jgi:hypothetical protein
MLIGESGQACMPVGIVELHGIEVSMAKTPKVRPGLTLERVVARIQQMMDLKSTVTHNEKLTDWAGNSRQYDVGERARVMTWSPKSANGRWARTNTQ